MDENRINDLLIDMAAKTERIEAKLDTYKETLDRVDVKLDNLEPLKRKVAQHDVIIKGYSWFMGLVVSFFTAKYLGKF